MQQRVDRHRVAAGPPRGVAAGDRADGLRVERLQRAHVPGAGALERRDVLGQHEHEQCDVRDRAGQLGELRQLGVAGVVHDEQRRALASAVERGAHGRRGPLARAERDVPAGAMDAFGELGRHPALADPAPAGHRDERPGAAADARPALPQPRELRVSPDERGRGGGVELRWQLGRRGPGLERDVLAQDRLLQPAQLGPGLDADLREQHAPRGVKGLERVCLAPAAVEREHPQAGEPLARRVGGHERAQLADDRSVAAQREVGLDAQLDRGEPLLLQAGDLVARERLELKLAERRPAPQRQRLAQDVRGMVGAAGAQRGAPFLDQAREALGVQLAGADRQAVARRRRGEDVVVAERLAQPRDVDLHGLHRA